MTFGIAYKETSTADANYQRLLKFQLFALPVHAGPIFITIGHSRKSHQGTTKQIFAQYFQQPGLTQFAQGSVA